MTTQEKLRLLTALTDIYEQTERDYKELNVAYLLRSNNVKYFQYVWKVMQDEKIVLLTKKSNRNQVKWNTIKPNIKMAEKIFSISFDRYNEWYEGSKTNKESKLTDNQKNIINLLNHVYDISNKNYVKINRNNLALHFKIKNYSHFSEATTRVKIFDVKGKSCMWIAKNPNNELAIEIEKECLNVANDYIKKQRSIKNSVGDKKMEIINNVIEKLDPKQYKKEFKVFGITIYSTITSEL